LDEIRRENRRKEDQILEWKEDLASNEYKVDLEEERRQHLLDELDKLAELLPAKDQKILYLYMWGDTPDAIGKHFHRRCEHSESNRECEHCVKGRKWASNALERIKKTLKRMAEASNGQSANVLAMKREEKSLKGTAEASNGQSGDVLVMNRGEEPSAAA
jgi:hypothetical protein